MLYLPRVSGEFGQRRSLLWGFHSIDIGREQNHSMLLQRRRGNLMIASKATNLIKWITSLHPKCIRWLKIPENKNNCVSSCGGILCKSYDELFIIGVQVILLRSQYMTLHALSKSYSRHVSSATGGSFNSMWTIVTPSGNMDLGQHWLRQGLLAPRHQSITWTNVDYHQCYHHVLWHSSDQFYKINAH